MVKDRIADLIEEAKSMGYVHGAWILYKDWPYTPLRIGFGLTYDPRQDGENITVGCTDEINSYYTAVPVYKNGEWTKILEDYNVVG